MTWLSILGQNHWSVVWRTCYGGARRNTRKPVSKLLQQAGDGTDSQFYKPFYKVYFESTVILK